MSSLSGLPPLPKSLSGILNLSNSESNTRKSSILSKMHQEKKCEKNIIFIIKLFAHILKFCQIYLYICSLELAKRLDQIG